MWYESAAQAFDATVYDPGYFGDDGDRRWESTEGAAAWARQCLTQASDSGTVCVLMPAAAASSSGARPLRRTLLRTGVLRAVVTGLAVDRDLWLLHEADGERPQSVLLMHTAGDLSAAAAVWQAFRFDPAHPEAERFTVRIIDRLDDYVDLTPERPAAAADRYSALRTTYLERPAETPPMLEPNPATYGVVTVGELAEAGMVEIHRSPPTVVSADGVTSMLTAKDIRLGRSASRCGDAAVAGAVIIRAGDVALAPQEPAVRVCTESDMLLGPGIDLLRADPAILDPGFLAGVLRAAIDDEHSGDIDLHTVGIPRLPPTEQRRCAEEFARLRRLEASWQERRADIEHLVHLGYRGLATGRLRPGTGK
ncbi:hypothetical protein AB0F65_04960 [Nocardia rhamnosiphila]|uniref:hypothetical protein n=1 Tax=Nocardia rhamnosiphila TaxID=426716 RepID=UPI0033C633D2